MPSYHGDVRTLIREDNLELQIIHKHEQITTYNKMKEILKHTKNVKKVCFSCCCFLLCFLNHSMSIRLLELCQATSLFTSNVSKRRAVH